MIRCLFGWALWALFCCYPLVNAFALDPIPLTLYFDEEAGELQPMTVGIPLPLTENGSYRVVNQNNQPQPCQLREQVRSTHRWVLLDFQARRGSQYFVVAGECPAPAKPVTLASGAGGIVTVSTGAASFTLEPKSNIFGRILNATGQSLALGASWSGLNTTEATLETVEVGPMRTMMRLTAPNALNELTLIARIHFYAGLPYARVQLTVVNHKPCLFDQTGDPRCEEVTSANHIALEDLTLAFTLANPGDDRDETLYQDSSGTDAWNLYRNRAPRMQSGVSFRGFQRRVNGQVSESGDAALGILGSGGIQLEIPYFRENFPKALRARGGKLEASLFPQEYSTPHRLRAGEQKTHDLWINLEPSSPAPWKARALPGYAYLRESRALGIIGPRTDGPDFQAYERYIDAQLDVTQAIADYDHYGWTDFGDLPQDFESGAPYNLKYDVNLGFLQQCLRTGQAEFCTLAEIANRHYADIDMYHSVNRDRNSQDRTFMDGLAWGHSLHDESGITNPHRNFNSPNPDVVFGGSGLSAWALLTGDDMIKDAAVELADAMYWVMSNTSDTSCARNTFGGGSGRGYGMVSGDSVRPGANAQRLLTWAWRLTGAQDYLDVSSGMADWYVCATPQFDCGSWPFTLITRSMSEYILTMRAAGRVPNPNALIAVNAMLELMRGDLIVEGDRARFNACRESEIPDAWMFVAADAFALGYAVNGQLSWLEDYALPSFNQAMNFWPARYIDSKELVNSVSAGVQFLHFANGGTPITINDGTLSNAGGSTVSGGGNQGDDSGPDDSQTGDDGDENSAANAASGGGCSLKAPASFIQ